jgi:hypothetical protein
MIIFNELACVAGVLAPFDGLLGKKIFKLQCMACKLFDNLRGMH